MSTPKISEYYNIFKDLVKQYYETHHDRKEIYQQINQYHKLIELERIKVLSYNYTNKTEVASWVNIVCQTCKDMFEPIQDGNTNDLSKAKKILDRINEIANSYNNIYSKKYCTFASTQLSAKAKKVVILGETERLKKCFDDTIKMNSVILNESNTSFLILLNPKIAQSVILPKLELIISGDDYVIYGNKRNDTLGLVIQQIIKFIDENGFDISDVSKRELMGTTSVTKKKIKTTKNS